MDGPGYEVRRQGGDADSDAGLVVFASMLSGEGTGITRFPFHLEASQQLAPHRHDADLAAGVKAGALVFGFGDGFRERVVLRPGDFIVIRAGVAHSEESGPDGPMSAKVACLGPFSTVPV